MRIKNLFLASAVCLTLSLPCSAAWQITLQDGCVALLQDNVLLQKSTMPAALLPEHDRALLRFALYFPSREAACRVMEDFTG